MYCHECAVIRKVKIQCPCTSHPNVHGNDIPTSLKDTFLYPSVLTGNCIRVLELEPGSGSDPIRCSLKQVSLDGADTYNTLSYSWGDANLKQTIICDEENLEITQSLYDALQQLREDGRTQPLWADAICINQSDVEEKTVQVRMMKEIYERSELTIAWLGKEIGTDASGFHLMRKIFETHEVPAIEDLFQTSYKQATEFDLPAFDHPSWVAFCKILYRPYFSRIWIIQEILMAKTCLVQCGSQIISREVLLGVTGIVDKFHYLKNVVSSYSVMDPGDTAAFVYTPRSLWFIKVEFDRNFPRYIINLLAKTRQFKATDPRDKIFALVSLSTDLSTDFIDYNKCLAEIQIEIAKIGMQGHTYHGAMLLSFVDMDHHSSDLPSWTPDWVSHGTVQAALAGALYVNHQHPLWMQQWTFTSDNKLQIRGIVFDKVKSVVHEMPYMTPTPTLHELANLSRTTQGIEAWDDACWELVKELPSTEYIGTGEHVSQAYWRTLIFNSHEYYQKSHQLHPETSSAQPPDIDIELAYGTWVSQFMTMNELFGLAEAFEAQKTRDAAKPVRWGPWYYLDCAVHYFRFISFMVKLHLKGDVLTKQAKAAQPFDEAFKRYCFGRKFFTSENGFMGWVPAIAKEGDDLIFFTECPLPFVVRKREGGYQLVGDCYLHGIMDLSEEDRVGFSNSEPITLV